MWLLPGFCRLARISLIWDTIFIPFFVSTSWMTLSGIMGWTFEITTLLLLLAYCLIFRTVGGCGEVNEKDTLLCKGITDLLKWRQRCYPAPCEMLPVQRARLEREYSAALAAARHTFIVADTLGRGNLYMCRALFVSHEYVYICRRRNNYNIQHASLNFRLFFILFYINFSAFLF